MIEIPIPTDKKDIEHWVQRQTSVAMLGQDLVPSDSHDETGAMMTENREWYFIPCEYDFVMSGRTILDESKPTDRPRWRIEIVKHYPGGWMEPDEYDLAEVGERSDSLRGAIERAAVLAKEYELQNISEGIFWLAENLKEKLGYYNY